MREYQLIEQTSRHVRSHRLRYSRHLLNMVLCRKKGDRVHTSMSFKVLVIASSKIGSTNENVDQDQRVTSSSGQERAADGIYKESDLLITSSSDGNRELASVGRATLEAHRIACIGRVPATHKKDVGITVQTALNKVFPR